MPGARCTQNQSAPHGVPTEGVGSNLSIKHNTGGVGDGGDHQVSIGGCVGEVFCEGGGGGRGGQMPPFYVDKHDFLKNRRRGPKAPVNPPNPPPDRSGNPSNPTFPPFRAPQVPELGYLNFVPPFGTGQCHCVGGWKRKCPNTPHLRVAMHVACQPRHPVGVRRYVDGISQVFDEF